MSFDAELDLLTHDHVFLGRDHDANQRRTLAVVILTALMMVAEIVAGLVFNSMALTADGFHMATHAGALGAAAAAYAFARRHARDPAYTFGTGKVGDLAGFASALVLAIIALGIGVESVLRFVHPAEVAYGEATIIAVVGLGVNLASALLLSGGLHHHHGHGHGHGHGHAAHDHHGHDHHAHDHHADDHHVHHDHDHHDHDHAAGHHDHDHAPAERDNNMRSAVVHVLADALTSVLAIVALLAGRFFGIAWLDPAMGLVGAVVILAWSRSLIRDTSAVLLDRAEPATEKAVRAELAAIGDLAVTDLHVWRVGPSALAAIVSVAGEVDAGIIRRRLTKVPGLAHLTVEVHARPLAA